MKNNKGIILSTYVYLLLVFFLLLLGTMLVVLNNTKILANKMKEGIESTTQFEDFSIALNGDSNIVIQKGETFTDPGYTAETKEGETLTATVDCSVDTNTVGEYVCTYKVRHKGKFKQLDRTINVIEKERNFNYTGSKQEWTAPITGWYKVELWGASGGSGHNNAIVNSDVGKGSYTTGIIKLNKGEKLYIYVGSKGGDAIAKTCTNTALDIDTGTGGSAGYNGGGIGGNDSCTSTNAANDAAGGGGGATDIRFFGSSVSASDLAWDSELGLKSRIMVAAGGGGTSFTLKAGSGGGLEGKKGEIHSSETDSAVANGGTQTSGFAFGKGGPGIYATTSNVGCGGGGAGYYGAIGHASTSERNHAGGGGSSFISGYAGSNAIVNSSDTSAGNNVLHYSGKYFIDGEMQQGINSGNGSAKVTYVSEYEPKRTNPDLNNVRYIKDCVSGNNSDSINRWMEVQAIYNGTNVARGITSTLVGAGTLSNATMVTNGDIGVDGSGTDAYSNSSCIIIDLGKKYNLDEIAVWHNWQDLYSETKNAVTSVSSDNSTWIEVIKNSSLETSEGKRINAWKNYTVTNMLINSNFFNSTKWYTETGSITTTGNIGTATSSRQWANTIAQDISTLDPTHIYYYSTYEKSTAQVAILLVCFDSAGTYVGQPNIGKDASNEFLWVTNRFGIPQTTAKGTFTIQNTTSSSNTINEKQPMLIDLTETFGVGNEPDENWCNENIPYFEGTRNFYFDR